MEDLEDPRQYECLKCNTLTVISKNGMRHCQCFKQTFDVVEGWEEVFFDRINE